MTSFNFSKKCISCSNQFVVQNSLDVFLVFAILLNCDDKNIFPCYKKKCNNLISVGQIWGIVCKVFETISMKKIDITSFILYSYVGV